MGRFESTAATYLRYREPYPPAFFSAVAEQLPLRGDESLVDLGTGPGVLALGFHRYVSSILGVDPEPAMLDAARQAAAAVSIELPLIESRTEDLPAEIGPFDVVTIGRALHWMDREKTLAALDRILTPTGSILICGPQAGGDDVNPWRSALEAVATAWSGNSRYVHAHVYAHFFEDSAFDRVGRIAYGFSQRVSAESLVERVLTRSNSSPAVIGPRIGAFRRELFDTLAPFFSRGERMEVLSAEARIYRRI